MRYGIASSSYGFDADASAYFASCSTLPSKARKIAINSLVLNLKVSDLWSRIDWLLLLASEDYATTKQASRVNLRAPSKVAVSNGALTYSANGVTGNAVSAYMGLPEVYNAGSNVFAQNSAFLLSYVTAGSDGSMADVGALGSNTIQLRSRPNTTQLQAINESTTVSYPNPGKAGCRILTRTGANATAIYNNGSLSGTGSAASVAVPVGIGTLFRNNTSYGDSSMAMMASGSGLNAAQAAALNLAVTTFLTAIGAI